MSDAAYSNEGGSTEIAPVAVTPGDNSAATVYLDGDQALFAGLVRAEFGPAARIVLFDGDDGSLYAEVEAGHAGHCIQRFDAEACESEWVGDCGNVPNPVYVSDFRTVALAEARDWAVQSG